MKKLNKKELLAEAAAQSKALGTIRKWLACAVGLSTISIALIIFGSAGETTKLLPCIFGGVLLVLSLASAFIINLGLRRGVKNVELILAEANRL